MSGGNWKPGQSGNPNGRPSKTRVWREAIAKGLPDAVETVMKAVENGDVHAAKFVIQQCLPPLKAITEPAPIPGLGGTVAEQGHVIIAAMGRGDIAAEEAGQLFGVLLNQTRIIESTEIVARLVALEDRGGLRSVK